MPIVKAGGSDLDVVQTGSGREFVLLH